MSYDWGPHYIVPSEVLKKYSGNVLLREKFEEDLAAKELEELGFTGPIVRVTNPWYYRKKNAGSWIKIGESDNISENFPMRWDTTKLENGRYEILGLMHIFARKGAGEQAIARENVVEVTVEN